MTMQPIILQHVSLPSTMDEGRKLANTDALEFTVVQAYEQTAGRGRFGNQWSSPPGNLYMTVIFRPDMPVRACAQLSFVLALALADTIEHAEARLKWPNDVLVDGKKIAGILLEMESGGKETPDYLLAGMGVNIASGPEGSAILCDYMPAVTVEEARDRLLENIAHWYERWLFGHFDDIRSAWLSRAHGVGQEITARFADRSIDGIFEGLDKDGNLILRQANGDSRIISSGSIHFRP